MKQKRQTKCEKMTKIYFFTVLAEQRCTILTEACQNVDNSINWILSGKQNSTEHLCEHARRSNITK